MTSPLSLYQQALSRGEFQPDDVQKEAVTRLDVIYQSLKNKPLGDPPVQKGLFGRLSGLIGKPSPQVTPPIEGLYMWGGVGRGKTWIMDLFFQSVPSPRKLRLHFHRFMLRVHQELAELQGQVDPLLIIADRFKAETDLLCFDEFFVSDITDAMLLGTLMEALFNRGITLVATSNIPPDELYRNGLQRARFLPAIEQIKRYCQVMNVDAGIDYRLRTLTSAHLWKTPITAAANTEMTQMFSRLSGQDYEAVAAPVLEINHRAMATLKAHQGVVALAFNTLCGEGRSQLDYIALSKQFHTVLLFDMPVLTGRTEDSARRFLALVDEFYERHVKLVVCAAVALEEIYQGNQLKFEYQRCLSRLQEMQSEEYLRRPHLP